MTGPEDHLATYERTLDLAEVARVARGDRVRVQEISDATQDLFDRTLALVERELGDEAGVPPGRRALDPQHVPVNPHLRTIYLLAEAVGGYDTFNDLMNAHSPGNALSRDFGRKAQNRALEWEELRQLREYQVQIRSALRSANEYLRDVAVDEFSRAELSELHEVILIASGRARELNDILGSHYIHEVERAVERLYAFHDKMRTVERTVDGIFMVNSEVMFVPTNELVECVNTLFEAVGNSYLARNIDGVLLLAARNLLIEVCSFHSYYGKQQVYNLFRRGSGGISAEAVTARIRSEIRRLFEACQRDNRLVLTRVMRSAEREFEISVEAIQEEAVSIAYEQVQVFMPREDRPREEPRRGLLARMLRWFVESDRG
jgi:hypothetical protein